MVDSYPGVSQLKSLAQVACGDREGARLTQDHFINDTAVVCDATYLYKLAKGDKKGAKATRHRCNKAWNKTVNAVPILGHFMSVCHLCNHNKQRAMEALNSANRASVLITSALLTGGVAAPLAVAASAIGYDTVDSLVSHQGKGVVGTVQRALNNPTQPGIVFDAIVEPALVFAPTTNIIRVLGKAV